MKITILVKAGCGIILSVALFAIWYSVAANYDYGALASAEHQVHSAKIPFLYSQQPS